MTYKRCWYELFGVERRTVSIRDAWRHLMAVLHALAPDRLEQIPHWALSSTPESMAARTN